MTDKKRIDDSELEGVAGGADDFARGDGGGVMDKPSGDDVSRGDGTTIKPRETSGGSINFDKKG